MNIPWRILLIAGLLATSLASTGCSSVWHNMQLHRLHQMNRGPGMVTGPEAYSFVDCKTPALA